MMKLLMNVLMLPILCLLIIPASAEPDIYYNINDHQQRTVALMDESKTVVWRVRYQPFGEVEVVQDDLGLGVMFGFAGQYWEGESGLFYNHYRDYDPSLGRYIQSDPIGLAGGLNTYGYALQNPIMYADPAPVLLALLY